LGHGATPAHKQPIHSRPGAYGLKIYFNQRKKDELKSGLDGATAYLVDEMSRLTALAAACGAS
jgi:hypothetical protein